MKNADGAAKCYRENVLEYTKFCIGVTLRIPKCGQNLSSLFSV